MNIAEVWIDGMVNGQSLKWEKSRRIAMDESVKPSVKKKSQIPCTLPIE